ncbi:hypothetical protein PVNG_03364 [Plasmodium vivax North Korean]|uniref:Uncharacterized protein n=1 Tax=Plasmodium vivax North Korean TaxID=1035514 RepID=A0A0J9TWH5_PLAVI|nr:hypothetical protein PVNG_03364 [Plasmodium vivax North Korean]
MFHRASATLLACVCYALTIYNFPSMHAHAVSPKRQATNLFFLPTHFNGVSSRSRKIFRLRYASRKDCSVTLPTYTASPGARRNCIEAYYSEGEKGKCSPLYSQRGDVAPGGDTSKGVRLTGKKNLEEASEGVIQDGSSGHSRISPVNPTGETPIGKDEHREGVGTPLNAPQAATPPDKDANQVNYDDVSHANGLNDANNANRLNSLNADATSPKQAGPPPLAQPHQKRKKKKTQNEEVRKKLSELAKLRWRDQEERKKLLRCKNQFKHSEKTKQLLSYKIKLKWTDENYRKSIIAKTRIFNQDENTKRRKSILLRQKWKTKEFREKMLSGRKPFTLERRKRISEIIKQKWREDDYKQKTLQAIKDNYKKRKLQVGLNPNFNYVQNAMLFKRLGLSAPKMRFFPSIHREKLRGKKKRKKKRAGKDPENYRENWRNIYDSLLDTNELQHSLAYLNHVGNLSVSTNT